jgi:hypothetical protein
VLDQLRCRSSWKDREAIVLLHDGRINTERRTAENTVALIQPLVESIRKLGWSLTRLAP